MGLERQLEPRLLTVLSTTAKALPVTSSTWEGIGGFWSDGGHYLSLALVGAHWLLMDSRFLKDGSRGPVTVALQKSSEELMISSIWKNDDRLDMEVTFLLSGEEWGVFRGDWCREGLTGPSGHLEPSW